MGVRANVGDHLRRLLSERLAPGKAAAAVFVGIVLGVVPIYGAQSIVALTLATLMRLNRPLTLAGTFVNNPLLQPLLVFSSIEIGHRALHGSWLPASPSSMMANGLQPLLLPFFLGSLVLAVLLAVPIAALAYVGFAWKARQHERGSSAAGLVPQAEGNSTPSADAHRALEQLRAEVARRYAGARSHDRQFVRWKVRLDRVFRTLLEQDLGRGTVVDLGCGYGLALLAAAIKDAGRPLRGCDLDAGRIEAARQALAGLDVRLSVADAGRFEIPPAGLVLIIDVLQYFDRAGQTALLSRCCEALEPGGRLIFRIPETAGGLTARLTAWLDVAVFRSGGARQRPTYMAPADYRDLLTAHGLTVMEQHARNRLPLSHVLFVAQKPPHRPHA